MQEIKHIIEREIQDIQILLNANRELHKNKVANVSKNIEKYEYCLFKLKTILMRLE